MRPINNSSLSAAQTAFNTLFNTAFAKVTPQWDQIAMLVPSTTKVEAYAWLSKLPRFREWVGDRVLQNLGNFEFTIKNKSFENTIAVEREDIEDDLIGVYKPMFEMMGYSAAVHPDQLVFALLAAADSTKCYDGQYFFDTDHPVQNADRSTSNVSNFTAGSSPLWALLDTSKPVKPFVFQKRKDYDFIPMDNPQDERVFMNKQFRYGVDARVNVGPGLWQLAFGSRATLDAAGYTAARQAMMGFKDDAGIPLGITPKTLVVGPSNEIAARTIVTAPFLAGGATNVLAGTAEVVVSPFLP